MLYIDDIGNNTIRLSDTSGGGGTADATFTNNAVAWSDEIDRVWCQNKDSNVMILNCYDPAKITVGGTAYANASHCAQALNALFAEEAVALLTTTTTAAATTTTTAP